ncbi:MAG TPA: MFS transporter [Candidatus Limnocylindrales bacterium]
MSIRQRWTMVAAILGSATVFLDGTVVNVALPKIGEELPASIVGVLEGETYATSGYLATLAALLILAGALADYYGRRRVFSIGLAGFGIASVLCGIAPNLELFVLFRIVQGAAGALLVPCSLSIITATFEGPQRARAFGIWAAATSATTLAGPILSGLLVDYVSWRVAFLINVPILAVALWATRTNMDESRDEQASGRFDWVGAVDVVLAVGGLAFGGIRGQQTEWSDPIAYAALVVGAVAFVAFPFLMSRRRDPLVPLGLFRSRDFSAINLSTFLIYAALR